MMNTTMNTNSMVNDTINTQTYAKVTRITETIVREVTIETTSNIAEALGRCDMFPNHSIKHNNMMLNRMETIFNNLLKANMAHETISEHPMFILEEAIANGDFEQASIIIRQLYKTSHPEVYVQLIVSTLYECATINVGTVRKYRNLIRFDSVDRYSMAIEIYGMALRRIRRAKTRNWLLG